MLLKLLYRTAAVNLRFCDSLLMLTREKDEKVNKSDHNSRPTALNFIGFLNPEQKLKLLDDEDPKDSSKL